MQKGRKRKGISLSHHTNRLSSNIQSSPQVQRTGFTLIQFPLYQLSHSTVKQTTNTAREDSVPKPKINFNYPINYSNSHVSTESRRMSMPILQSEFPLGFTEKNGCVETKNSTQNQLGNPISNPTIFIPERYESFQKCKETIAKKLFGQNKSNSKDTNASQRSNRFKRYQITQFTTNIEIVPQNIHQLISINQKLQNKPAIAVKPPPKPLQTSSKINQIPYSSLPVIPQKLEAVQNQQVEHKNQVNNKSELIKKKRNPMKLQEMEKRLKQIIKICDQNI